MQPSPLAPAQVWHTGGWSVHDYPVLPSTNPVAATLPPWSAVRAEEQTGGRGRTGRHWVSNRGGLWISAVVPVGEPRKKWAVLPLAVGWAVTEALRNMGVEGLRLRWPNDIMVGPRKLAGLLVEMFGPNAAVVGVGINVSNDPIQGDAALFGHTINLHALLASKPTVNEVAALVLASLRRTHAELDSRGFAHLADAINRHWDRQRSVELTLNTGASPIRGEFLGIDAEGRLIVRTLEGAPLVLEASQVALLRELD